MRRMASERGAWGTVREARGVRGLRGAGRCSVGTGGVRRVGGGARAAQGQLMSSSCTAGRFEFKRGAHGEPGGSGGHVGSEADGARSRLVRDADARGE